MRIRFNHAIDPAFADLVACALARWLRADAHLDLEELRVDGALDAVAGAGNSGGFRSKNPTTYLHGRVGDKKTTWWGK